MKPQWEPYLGQITDSYSNWVQVYPTLTLQLFPYNGLQISTSELDEIFLKILNLVKFVAKSDNINPLALSAYQESIYNTISNISSTVISLPSNPAAALGTLSGYLWTLFASLAWLMPPGSTEHISDFVKNEEVIGTLNEVHQLCSLIQNKNNEGNNYIEEIKNILNLSKERYDEIANQLNLLRDEARVSFEKITNYERESANAKLNSEASAQSVTNNKESIEHQLTEITTALTRHNEALSQADSLIEKATYALEGTSKAALAASFGARRSALEESQHNWRNSFSFGILSLILVIILTSTGTIPLPPIVITDGKIDTWAAIVRIMFTGPSVWFTWFAARQYSFTLRLIEDYAFKEASALAFIGYKREMGDDEDMLKLLRESAIKNFGASPTRMLSKSDISSPMHEIIDKAMDNEGFLEKLIKIIGALKPEK